MILKLFFVIGAGMALGGLLVPALDLWRYWL